MYSFNNSFLCFDLKVGSETAALYHKVVGSTVGGQNV